MAEVYERALARLFPERCPRCAAPAQRGYCRDCKRDFSHVADPCPACGLARPVARCPLRRTRWQLDALVAPFDYTAPLAAELVALKRAPGRRLGRALGLLLAEHVASAGQAVDAVVPVPLHATRLRERGFNQAAELARALARELGLEPLLHAAARTRRTRLQAGLDPARRAANLAGVFRARAGVAGRRIAIVDDIVTTGATVNALAAALRTAGAATVEAWAVARTHPERSR